MTEETQTKEESENVIFAVRCTANREDQVLDFLSSNISKKKLQVFSAFHPHGMRGYIFIETIELQEAQRACYQVPYARGVLDRPVSYKEIEHMFDVVKTDISILKGDIAEIISGPFKREQVKITRVDMSKEEVIVELLEAAVPIPITVKMDAVKVIRRDDTKSSNTPTVDDYSDD
ncbi:MAG: transcriptional antiterminator NusG [Candidatus Woesearchaeota archaeon]|jgi:transcriptional antiterminator NusG